MIVVKLISGLGNQMFQYALGKVLSKESGNNVFYDTSFYLNKNRRANEQKKGICRDFGLFHFNVNIDEEPVPSCIKRYWRLGLNKVHRWFPILSKILNPILKIINSLVFNEYYFDEYYPNQNYNYRPDIWGISAKNTYYIGYWQSEKYFLKYRNDILHDFQITTPQSQENKVWSERITNSNSVSLHIRRGDYPSNWVLDIGYYTRAIEYISKHIEKPVFFVFSDDMQWAKHNLMILEDVYFIEQNSQAEAYEDLRLMSQCKHNIIANSSFSWWGAWLNQNSDNIVVAPNSWVEGHNIEDIVPDRWIRL